MRDGKSISTRKAIIISALAMIALKGFFSIFGERPNNPESKEVAPAGTYSNPIIYADYSDPDVCRVGEDYYMTSSSFNCFPGLQILHSRDLVHWELIGAALADYPAKSDADYDEWHNGTVQHGNGVWAPAIRYHDGWFYIYCGDPDRGIFMVKTKDPRGPWSEPVWLVRHKGYIDPCPLWDEDGKAYLSHAAAGSRAGVKSVVFVAPMAPDGTTLLGPSRIVYDGHADNPTIEGTKFHKRGDWYYIFAPAGGVSTGWQTVLRSKSPFGPYEFRKVLEQGESSVNGPHQGAWVDAPDGSEWFLHFQDCDAYGRIVHLQPMGWTEDGWPVMGTAVEDASQRVGEPVGFHAAPSWAPCPATPEGLSGLIQTAEDAYRPFGLPLEWQWHSVPKPEWSFAAPDGSIRLYSVQQNAEWKSLADTPNLLLQKFPAESFSVEAKLRFTPSERLKYRNEVAGFVVMGEDYLALEIVSAPAKPVLKAVVCTNALKGGTEKVLFEQQMEWTEDGTAPLHLDFDVKLHVAPGAVCTITCAVGSTTFEIPGAFTAKAGRWIGAKYGCFANRFAPINDAGFLDILSLRLSE